MGTLRNIRHHIAVSVRRLLKSPRNSVSKIKLHRNSRGEYGTPELNTPDSSRSVSFTEAITWPYIDEDINEE
ncbi:uncharacterized protein CELE_C01G5.25 [Caenorhabditis elegans]|uniref:Uncharacterized protein n=1 Tax=Caenorhabditis elegans TaxID=6239 RepID=U4PB93_CAEEL|nr:Uncharacterized protein CELE_C01G5.25 [Caenorhabditis elegans]CDH93012.1 Uncharacterized protein CELE_C01G5.25 [Caenorhabditis elegans]|eukprot:NP_001294310.1 Uncharacterized protein CELE_C01G5.25 [Caenorhabditis elegans]